MRQGFDRVGAAAVSELPTLAQAEDAAANALADLILQGLESRRGRPGITLRDALREIARELLRGPVDEADRGQRGGYCMRAPADPVLGQIRHVGNRLVELSYTVHDPARALEEARRWFDELGGGSSFPQTGSLPTSSGRPGAPDEG
jgi:hypothetical protein